MSKKTILVTGSSRGLGKAIAIKYAKKGYNVVINCLKNEELLSNVKKEIESYQTSCLAFVGDVGNFDVAVKYLTEAGIPESAILNTDLKRFSDHLSKMTGRTFVL